MGNLSIAQEMQINEVFVQENGTSAIACSFSQDAKLQLIVHDKLGRAVLTEEIQVDASTNELLIDSSNLKSGDYHAWIYLEDKVFVKYFSLPEAEDSGFLGKFFSKFR